MRITERGSQADRPLLGFASNLLQVSDDGLIEKLLEVLLPPDQAPPVCIDCYRDGGCREHSRPDDGEDDGR